MREYGWGGKFASVLTGNLPERFENIRNGGHRAVVLRSGKNATESMPDADSSLMSFVAVRNFVQRDAVVAIERVLKCGREGYERQELVSRAIGGTCVWDALRGTPLETDPVWLVEFDQSLSRVIDGRVHDGKSFESDGRRD